MVLSNFSVIAGQRSAHADEPHTLTPGSMSRLATIDERYQSYNIEMLEVTGGKFWKPYKSAGLTSQKGSGLPAVGADIPSGMDPNLYEYRPPIDLKNPRLRKLAVALG